MPPPPGRPPPTAWRPLLTGLVASLLALAWQHPPASRSEGPHLRTPPDALFLQAAALGRSEAAADLLWLRSVQFVGSPGSDAAGYPGLGLWLTRMTELAPRFASPYLTGGILLATVPAQTDAAAALLARAERTLAGAACDAASSRPAPSSPPESADAACTRGSEVPGCSWEIPLWRGFLAYFGQLDAATAAEFYCEAARRGGPAYLTRMARRLREQSAGCRALRARLGDIVSSSQSFARAGLLTREDQLRIVLNCEANALKQASGAFRLRFSREPASVSELVREGLLEEPFTLPGQCWEHAAEGWAMAPCATPRTDPR